MTVDPRLLALLCCPDDTGGEPCHGALEGVPQGLRCTACGLVYPIEDGIPVMLPQRAQRFDFS